MRKLTLFLHQCRGVLAPVPAFAGMHYKSTTKTEAEGEGRGVEMSRPRAGSRARRSRSPFFRATAALSPRRGPTSSARTAEALFLVKSRGKTYAEWSLQGMLGTVGAVMNGMGPLLKVQFTDVKPSRVAEEDGGTGCLGVPTRHYTFHTSYTMAIKVLGMGNTSRTCQRSGHLGDRRAHRRRPGRLSRADPQPPTGTPA